MKPPFAYVGGKTRHADWIASHLPTHETYVEPFAGSAAVLFAKRPVRHEVLNDIDGEVVNFYRVLRERLQDLETAVRLTPYSREEYDAADFAAEDLDPVERARRWWVRSTQGFGQSAHDAPGWSISTSQTTDRPHQLTTRIGRFAACADRLRQVFIECGDALDLVARFAPDPSVAMYLDPPYLASTRTDTNLYRHEMKGEDEHRALAAAIGVARAAVVVSGYHSPLYDELFDGWYVSDRRVIRAGNGCTPRADKAVEVLWSNRPFAAPSLFDEGEAS